MLLTLLDRRSLLGCSLASADVLMSIADAGASAVSRVDIAWGEAPEGDVERTGASSRKTERLRGLLTNGTTFSAAAAAAAVAVLFGVVMAVEVCGYV